MIQLIITIIISYVFIRDILRELKSYRRKTMALQNGNQDEEVDANSEQDNVLEFCKLEYTTGVKRHDDIYKSMWTNFSYMAILAGGILTFGKDQLTIQFLVIVACLPLIFWFWSSFLPLDRYGNMVARRMAELERFVNKEYFTGIEKPSYDTPTPYKEEQTRKGLFLYSDFEIRKEAENSLLTVLRWILKWILFGWLARWISENIRVRHPMWLFSVCLHVILIISFCKWRNVDYGIINDKKNETTEKRIETVSNNLQDINKSINGLSNSVNGLSNLYEKHVDNINKEQGNTSE